MKGDHWGGVDSWALNLPCPLEVFITYSIH